MKRPSPSMVVSVIALVVAMTGSATAATVLIKSSKQIRSNSILASDIRNSQLTGVDVKNGSLSGLELRDDTLTDRQIKKDSITADSLAPSVRNTLRGTGLTGQEVVRKTGPAGVQGTATIATLKGLEPGTYLLMAKTTINPDISDQGLLGALINRTANAECVLDAAGDQDNARAVIATPQSPSPSTMNLQMTRTTDSPIDVALKCTVNEVKFKANDASIIALRLTGSTRQDTTG